MTFIDQLFSSPLLASLAGALFLVSCITTLDKRIAQAKRSGILPTDHPDLPGWVTALHFLDWGLLIALLVLNWRIGLFIWVVLLILKVLPVLETIGNFLMRPFQGTTKQRIRQGLPTDLKEAGEQISALAFPGGNEQIDQDTEKLYSLLSGAISKPMTKELLFKSKALLVISQDKSQSRIIPSIQANVTNRLTAQQCNIVYEFITGSLDYATQKDDGSTVASAVKINATSAIAGINAEYTWLEARFGKKGHDWSIGDRWHDEVDGKTIETFVLNFKDGSTKEVHFDISSVFGGN